MATLLLGGHCYYVSQITEQEAGAGEARAGRGDEGTFAPMDAMLDVLAALSTPTSHGTQ